MEYWIQGIATKDSPTPFYGVKYPPSSKCSKDSRSGIDWSIDLAWP